MSAKNSPRPAGRGTAVGAGSSQPAQAAPARVQASTAPTGAKQRLDIAVARLGVVQSRSQAENYIRLGQVTINGRVVTKPGFLVPPGARVQLQAHEQYVSRAGLKLASVAQVFGLQFDDAVVLDIGSSTGGFTDYALQHGARRVYAVDVGTNQLHPTLRGDARICLHEKTDIRDFIPPEPPTIIVGDVSFISLRQILPHVAQHAMGPRTTLVAMVKPQFEAGPGQTTRGVVKNNAMRRRILADFEAWAGQYFVIMAKRDSQVAGAKGNVERFYKLRLRG
ncbi:TlyA family RNA methyltransferase [Candidatus Saccharibacteria bacterium]|nr:TlyA family RNA methyltransferase [Candidatus Saccharibacteria bacterium]